MLHKTKLLSLVLLLAIFVGSCDEEPAGSNSVPSRIVGKVGLREKDSAGVIYSDRSGVSIKIEGTQISALTNTDGEYSLVNVPPGEFTLSVSKAGFRTSRQFIQHGGVGVSFAHEMNLYLE